MSDRYANPSSEELKAMYPPTTSFDVIIDCVKASGCLQRLVDEGRVDNDELMAYGVRADRAWKEASEMLGCVDCPDCVFP